MQLLEHHGKRLLAEAGLATPAGRVAESARDAADAAGHVGGTVVVKSQVTAGKRGKAGGIRFASSAEEARQAAADLLGSTVSGYEVRSVLVEQRVEIARELYAAVLNDAGTKGPLVLFSTSGGMDIEELHATAPDAVRSRSVDIRCGLDAAGAEELLDPTDLTPGERGAVGAALVTLYELYRRVDAELVEVNPLVLDVNGAVWALDCKLSIDDGARRRQEAVVSASAASAADEGTALERRGRQEGFLYIELDGQVGVLANGAGLTMTTLDAVHHYGGRPANFLEIGGEAYTKATPALRLVLDNPNVRSVLVNFCGAFARTDVMTEGVVRAIEELRPEVPFSFSIHGTGEDEAIQLVRDRLGLQPHDLMDDAVREAVGAARSGGPR